MNRYHLLAAEIYSYSYANYRDRLGIGNIRYEKLMPNAASTLERAVKENWDKQRIARALEIDLQQVDEYLADYRAACEVVDAENPAESFRWAVRSASNK